MALGVHFFWRRPEMAVYCLGGVVHPANSLENVLNRQEIEWRVCKEKKLEEKIRLSVKLEHFFEHSSLPPQLDLILLRISM